MINKTINIAQTIIKANGKVEPGIPLTFIPSNPVIKLRGKKITEIIESL
jgi:hypothetical protein